MPSNYKIVYVLGLVFSCSLLNIVEGEDTVDSLTVQLRELKEALGQRDGLDQQQKVQISRLTENIHSFAESMKQYVTLLENGQMQEEGGEGGDRDNRSCSTELVLNHVQSSLAKLGDLQDSVTSLGQSTETIEALNLTNRVHHQQRSQPISSSACTHNLTSIQSALTVNASRYSQGFWGRDVIRNDGIIYLAEDYEPLRVLKEYLSEAHLQQDLVHKVHSLPRLCSGSRPASVIRDRHFICANRAEKELFMFDLDTDRLVRQRGIGSRPRWGNIYWRSPQTVDLSADDSWVWMVYAQRGKDHMLLDKLDPHSLETVATLETHLPLYQIRQSFMILGVIYTLSSTTNSPSYITHIYNTRDGESRMLEDGQLVMPTARRICPIINGHTDARIITLNYDPWDKALYAWNCHYMEKYSVQLALQCT